VGIQQRPHNQWTESRYARNECGRTGTQGEQGEREEEQLVRRKKSVQKGGSMRTDIQLDSIKGKWAREICAAQGMTSGKELKELEKWTRICPKAGKDLIQEIKRATAACWGKLDRRR